MHPKIFHLRSRFYLFSLHCNQVSRELSSANINIEERDATLVWLNLLSRPEKNCFSEFEADILGFAPSRRTLLGFVPFSWTKEGNSALERAVSVKICRKCAHMNRIWWKRKAGWRLILWEGGEGRGGGACSTISHIWLYLCPCKSFWFFFFTRNFLA